MINKILIAVVIVLVLGGGYAWYFNQPEAPEAMMEREDEEMMKEEKDEMMTDDSVMMNESDKMMAEYQGTVLAGTSAPLLDFTKADFDKAFTSDKLIVLYFYANWCPICRVEFPKMQEAFNELDTDKVIAFRVNYNDSDTDQSEVDLAREYGVAYQHTKVFVKNRERILKSPESWDKARYLNEINKLTQ